MNANPLSEKTRWGTLLVRFAELSACGAVGYMAAGALAPAPPPPPTATAESAATALPQAAPTTAAITRDNSLLAEWDELRAEHASTPDAFPALYEVVKDIKDSFRRRAFRAALFAEWAATNPQAGIAYLIEEHPTSAGQVLREWMRLDPDRAISQMLASGEKNVALLLDAMTEVARSAPARLAEVASRFPEKQRSDQRAPESAFAVFAKKDPEAARIAAESVTGPARGAALAGVARAWAETDGAAALAWTQAMPKGDARDLALGAVLVGWAKSDPLAALGKLDLVPPVGRDMGSGADVSAQVLSEAASKDWDGTLRWLREHPGKLGQMSLYGLTSATSRRLDEDPIATLRALEKSELPNLQNLLSNSLSNADPARRDSMWKWLEEQPASAFTKSAQSALVNATAYREPEVALALLEKLHDSPESRDLLAQGTRIIINGAAQQGGFEALLAKASPNLRPLLLESAFASGHPSNGADPAIWAERLHELPAGQRPQAVSGLAQSWAANDPEGATRWALSLPDPQQRAQAISSAVGTWSATDRSEAAEWINTLPAGADRDTATVTLVGALGRSDPEAAWTWALSVQTPQHRQSALQFAFRTLQEKNPALAQEMAQARLSRQEFRALVENSAQ